MGMNKKIPYKRRTNTLKFIATSTPNEAKMVMVWVKKAAIKGLEGLGFFQNLNWISILYS